MPGHIDVSPITNGLLAVLAATGHPVGDEQAPLATEANPDPTKERYSVLRRIDGGSQGGTMGEAFDEVVLPYQVDVHGRSREQCDWLLARVYVVMLRLNPDGTRLHPVPGVIGITPQGTAGPRKEGVDDKGRELWVARPRFDVWCQADPASGTAVA